MHTLFVVLAVIGAAAVAAVIVIAALFIRQIDKNGWNN